MSSEIAISANGVSKKYLLYERPLDRLKQLLLRGRKNYYRTFTALEDISFDIPKGRTLGIIGQNGSGKSTLLQIICGTLQPTSGGIRVHGRVSALLELGSGFNPEFTGRENVILHGALMGYSPDEMVEKLPAIEAFAEIGQFIDQPVKTYSSGMFVRLAFAAAVHVEPDILVVDEALAVGDVAFQHKCMTRMREFMRQGTVIFVSHDIAAVTSLCQEVIWLEHGQIKERGDPKTVTGHYLAKMLEEINRTQQPTKKMSKDIPLATTAPLENLFNLNLEKHESFGTRGAEITGIAIYNENHDTVNEASCGQTLYVHVTARSNTDIAHPIIGLSLMNIKGSEISATNTDFEQARLRALSAGETCTVRFKIKLPEIAAGSYSLSCAIGDGAQSSHKMLHWVHNAAILQITTLRPVLGLIRLPVEVSSNQ
ncbi:MAG: ABC transporter ATP-binding protein [Gammaproteobacteria bacterium]|nr:ABC transporter ATP-binding protein [Gammaproteobacteria bacterium]